MSIRPESRAKFEKQGVLLTKLNLEMGNMGGPISRRPSVGSRRKNAKPKSVTVFDIQH
jgi:hypothetical protein